MLRSKSKDCRLLASRIDSWLQEWVQTNRYWKFSHPESSDGFLDFFRDFSGPPTCFTPRPGVLCVRLEGRPETKKAWKDWLALRLLKDLRNAFDEITIVQTVADCPSATRRKRAPNT